MNTRTRLVAAVATALGVVLALVGCVSIPTAGPVGSGEPVALEPGEVLPLAEGPQPGADPAQIVLDFIRAGAAGFGDDFLVAREYLTPAAQAAWEPREQVLVYSPTTDSLSLTERSLGRVQVDVEVSATVDRAGRFVRAAVGERSAQDFRLQVQDGEWRITQLPDAVLLNEPNFLSVFRLTSLYFPTTDGAYLVPDQRWFPQRNNATSAVQAMFGGPAPWLADAVTNPAGGGIELSLGVVTVTEGVATVDLTPEALTATPRERAQLQAQLEAVLLRLPGIREVALAVSGAPLSAEVAELVRDPDPGPGPVVLTPEGVALLEDEVLAPLVPVPEGVAASNPAVGPDEAVVVLDAGTRVVQLDPDGGEPVPLLEGGRLLAPSVDRFGWVWSGEVDALTGVLDAARPGEASVSVTADWLAGRMLHTVRVSRDGARVLVVSGTGSGLAVEVAAVVRDPRGVPLRLGPQLVLGTPTGAVAGAGADGAWVDETTVAVLSSTETRVDLRLYRIGGRQPESMGVVEGAISLAAGKGDRSIHVLTEDGTLYARAGTSWTPVAEGVLDPAFPG